MSRDLKHLDHRNGQVDLQNLLQNSSRILTLFYRMTRMITASKSGTGRLCLLILRQSTISKSVSGNASGCSIGLAIPASAHSPSRSKAMKIRKSGKLLKKTRRNRKRRIPYPGLSGRSPFSDSDYGDISLVQKGKCAYCKIFSGAFQGVLQRLRYSGKRGIIHRKASNL